MSAGLQCKYPAALRKQIKAQLKTLRKAYSAAVSGKAEGVSEWLRDNYYLIEREGKSARAELKYTGRLLCTASLPDIYSLCRKAALNFAFPITKALELLLETSENIGTRELDSLPLMLKAAYVHLACDAVKGDHNGAQLIAHAVSGLRELPNTDFDDIICRFSKTERILASDPSGIYPKMDDDTRRMYRHLCVEIAEEEKTDEEKVAAQALKNAQAEQKHIGFFLENIKRKKRLRTKGTVCLAAYYVCAAAISVMASVISGKFFAGLLIFFPVLEILRPLLQFFSMSGVDVRPMPKMELERGVPEGEETLVTVSTLVPSPEKAQALCAHFEQLFRMNSQGEIKFCILADLRESKSPVNPEDKLALSALSRAVKELNSKIGGKVILAVRPRVKIKTQGKYAGYERKRGAILQLIRYISGEIPDFLLLEGDKDFLRRVKYLIALDSDTQLLMDTASRMVSAAMHPLNAPVIDEKKGIVTSGFGIITPKIGTEIESGAKTPFARILTGAAGITSYDTLSGDFYQDLFGSSIFSGKGLINVEAFYKCLNTAFEDEKVLSHDILEGGFLRTGFMSDVEIVDGCPVSAGGFLSRQHRWIRGDWQNVCWLTNHPNKEDKQAKNPLPALTKYMLFDNLRRSFTPVMALVCMISAVLCHEISALLISAALLSVAAAGLFSAFISLISGGIQMLSRKYHSKMMPWAFTSIAQAMLMCVMLVRTGFLSLSAISVALWRVMVSKKNLLQWVTAADADASKNSLVSALKQNLLPFLLAAALIIFGTGSMARLAAILILSCPFIMWAVSRPGVQKHSQPDPEDARRLRSYAAAMWRFYDELCGRQDNYLPPDNIQETPVYAIAHRTSPTNIGLMLLSIAAARDFGFIDTHSMCQRLSRSFDSIEKLSRHEGNLYNWYDTKTLEPLYPRFVSVVDSGNFACCLVTLYEAVSEYRGQSPEIPQLLGRIKNELQTINLLPMYNKKRRLFHIGYDVESGTLSSSFYDLLMSEARMTSYYAVATRLVPKKHWGALGRTLAREGAYAGPVSWTGTMFEYFMPHLLMPAPPNSLQNEALRFCVYCQRQRAKQKNAPYGCSESGFYAFDPDFNYQYKAHGIQRLGLRRGLSDEYVVSPYSTFLTLSLMPEVSLKNLEKLENMGMTGRYGFYEAVDFTLSRVGNAGYRTVRSYMAHHVGMSIISVANLLNDGIFRKRFMRNPDMSAAAELLMEKIPAGARIFDDVIRPDIPEKPGRINGESEEYTISNPRNPRVQLLSSGEWSTVITDTGSGVSFSRGVDITRRGHDIIRAPQGIFAAVSDGGKSYFLTSAPDYDSQINHRVEFSHNSASFFSEYGGLESEMQVSVPLRIQGERRKFIFRNSTGHKKHPKLLIYLEPCLAKNRDDSAHTAFSKLFIKCRYDKAFSAAVFWRITREGENGLFMAAGFADSRPFDYDFNRENVLTRPFGIASLKSAFDKVRGSAGVPDPCLAMKINLTAPAKSKTEAELLIAVGGSADEALMRLDQLRSRGDTPEERAPSVLSQEDLEARLASAVLPEILFPLENPLRSEAAAINAKTVEGLWEISVSGDLPIVVCELPEPDDIAKAEPYVRLHRRLRGCGVRYDLIFLYKEGGDYAKPLSSSLRGIVTENLSEGLIGKKGGIHFIDELRVSPETICLIKSVARHIAQESISKPEPHDKPYSPLNIKPVERVNDIEKGEVEVQKGVFCDDKFAVTSPPLLPWCHVIANEKFGTLVSDMSAGYTFAESSRENKLTPWNNDTRIDNRGEMLLMRLGDECYDLIWGSQAVYKKDSAMYTGRIGDVFTRVCITVKDAEKHISAQIHNKGDANMDITLAYYTEPVLGVTRETSSMIKPRIESGALYLKNPFSGVFSGEMYLKTSEESGHFVCQRGAFLEGDWTESQPIPYADPCAALILNRSLPPKRAENIQFILGWNSHRKQSETPSYPRNTIEVFTPDESLNKLVNHWLPAQFENSRLFGRTGFYQCGGAFGYRDQLQDICAELQLCPDIARQHILRCAAHQFKEGDVLHWWHELPEGSKGVRTRCSDDMLWLPYTVSEYVMVTGDKSVLDEKVSYLEAPELAEGEMERYFQPGVSEVKESVYDHCLKALARIKTGRKGLPLIGNGDWNDGFSGIGNLGQGESVWLAQFAAMTAQRFAGISLEREDSDSAKKLLDMAQSLKAAVDENAWDGKWYLRAFFDDGTPLGTHGADMCEIDLLPQAFAVLSGMINRERIESGLNEATRRLVDEDLKIIRLFAPSFDVRKLNDKNNPGYISAYPPGVRENGGQYTHSAVWLCLALLKWGKIDEAYRLISMINPAARSMDPEVAQRYKTEPYALAADVYSSPEAPGRGGWTLYTGAAAWYYRIIVQEMLGIKQRGGHLEFQPRLPTGWDGFSAKLNIGGTKITVEIQRSERSMLTVDGNTAHNVPLDRRSHDAIIEIPG